MKDIGFYISGHGTRFIRFVNHLEETRQTEYIDQIRLVVFDGEKENPFFSFCQNRNFNILHFEYPCGVDRLTAREKLSTFILENFISFNIDLGFVFGKTILVGDLLETYKNKLINFHPSLLPAFKGTRAIDKALKENAFLLGNTAHYVVGEVDSGPIIMQNIIHNSKVKTYDDVLDLQVGMMIKILFLYNQGRIHVKNNSVTIEGACYDNVIEIPLL